MFVEILSTIDSCSSKSLIEILHDIWKKQILDLSKVIYWCADWLARLPVQMLKLLKAFSKYFDHIV